MRCAVVQLVKYTCKCYSSALRHLPITHCAPHLMFHQFPDKQSKQTQQSSWAICLLIQRTQTSVQQVSDPSRQEILVLTIIYATDSGAMRPIAPGILLHYQKALFDKLARLTPVQFTGLAFKCLDYLRSCYLYIEGGTLVRLPCNRTYLVGSYMTGKVLNDSAVTIILFCD